MPETPVIVVVSNSSPLIALDHLGRLDLLGVLFGTVLVPPAVAQEVQPRTLLPSAVQLRIPAQPAGPRILQASLGAGESEALALAVELEADLVLLDDKAARRLAAAIGLPVSGTLGILLEAKRSGLVAAVRPLIDALRPLPFHISGSLYEAVLRKAGEGA
jgi:predicted nucleic acid-binding protein